LPVRSNNPSIGAVSLITLSLLAWLWPKFGV